MDGTEVPTDHVNWYRGAEPNHADEAQSMNELIKFCGQSGEESVTAGKWRDTSCVNEAYYVCEY